MTVNERLCLAPATSPHREDTAGRFRRGDAGAVRHAPAEGMPGDLRRQAQQLVDGLAAEPWGRVGPSIYETGRLVSLAPWVAGHAERVSYLVANQRPDGGWGGPDGYALIPTLSATEALLTGLRNTGTGPASGRPELARAADRGLRALHGWLRGGPLSLPDTPAADLIVPYLVGLLNQHLDELSAAPPTGLDSWRGDVRLGLPAGMTPARLSAVRRRLAAGAAVPAKLVHALEVLGDAARGARGADPLPPGTVGASPAATAAWLGPPAVGSFDGYAARVGAPRAYLDSVAARYAGPVPCTTPITVFERAWVLSVLARAGVPVTVPPELVGSLSAALGPTGSATAPGLPTDADTTSVTLYALALLGAPVTPESLLGYDSGGHFTTWPGEDGQSITTNAHVLDALGQHVRAAGGDPRGLGRHPVDATDARCLDAVRRLSEWLPERQRVDGSWQDRWHASPYYATSCCVLALGRYGHGPAVAGSVRRAVDWVLASQRPDGSWGRWSGTVEETAYAMTVLLGTSTDRLGTRTALRRGYAYLREAAGAEPDPALWHDKDLYQPVTIVRSATISALYQARRRPGLID